MGCRLPQEIQVSPKQHSKKWSTLLRRVSSLQPVWQVGHRPGEEGEPAPGQGAEEKTEGERQQHDEDPRGQGVLGEPDGEGWRGGNSHRARKWDQGCNSQTIVNASTSPIRTWKVYITTAGRSATLTSRCESSLEILLRQCVLRLGCWGNVWWGWVTEMRYWGWVTEVLCSPQVRPHPNLRGPSAHLNLTDLPV